MPKIEKEVPSKVVIVPRPSVPNDTSSTTVAKSGLEDALKRAPADAESKPSGKDQKPESGKVPKIDTSKEDISKTR